jgi:hypothetical protein
VSTHAVSPVSSSGMKDLHWWRSARGRAAPKRSVQLRSSHFGGGGGPRRSNGDGVRGTAAARLSNAMPHVSNVIAGRVEVPSVVAR